MSTSLTAMIFVLCLVTTIYIRLLWTRQSHLSPMTCMMSAMSIAMLIGLVSGVMVGIVFAGNLFYSTVISMGVGMFVGFLAGLPISIIVILEGILSGLMGGMMGAMLGEMVMPSYYETLTKIFFILGMALIFTVMYMITNESNEREKSSLFFRILERPTFLIIVFVLFFFLLQQLGPIYSQQENHDIHQHHNEH
ncbi:hypothetical protein LCL95_11020 [Bacillus timonensis]|nr:hypothetical protein [Bacillus timonensis]